MNRLMREGLEDFTVTGGVVSVLQYSKKYRHEIMRHLKDSYTNRAISIFKWILFYYSITM